MINKVILVGRIANDIELKTTSNGKLCLSFTLANETGYGDKKQVSFIPCTCWESLADNTSRYCHKGSLIAVEGRFVVRSYKNKDNKTVYVSEVAVQDIQFLDTKQSSQTNPAPQAAPVEAHFEDIDDGELPF